MNRGYVYDIVDGDNVVHTNMTRGGAYAIAHILRARGGKPTVRVRAVKGFDWTELARTTCCENCED